VVGQGNLLGNNIGAPEKAAPTVVTNTLQAAQDGLGFDYNNDGRGIGFNVPSLLGLYAVPPYYHNGAAESLAAVVGNVKHRTDNGRMTDLLTNAADQAKVVAFLESIDVKTVPFVPLSIRRTGFFVDVGWDTIVGARYGVEAKPSLDVGWVPTGIIIIGEGNRTNVLLSVDVPVKFVRLVAAP
jgi:hypothetical protein